MGREKVAIQLDPAVFNVPFGFTFRPIRPNENVFAYQGRLIAAFKAAQFAHESRYGLIADDDAPYSHRTGRRKRGAKWLKPDGLAAKCDGPAGAPLVPDGGTIDVTWAGSAVKVLKL